MEKETVRWGVISQGGRFYPAKSKEQAAKWAAYDYGEGHRQLNGTLAMEGTVVKPLEHTKHRVWYRPVGMLNVQGVLTQARHRLERLDRTPAFFRHFEGSYEEVSIEAERLNQIQTRSNYLDYLYFPEPLVEADDFAENVDLEELYALPAYGEQELAA